MAGKKSELSLEERFWAKVDKSRDCWLWTAATNGTYGVMGSGNERDYAHRLAVIFDGRGIPKGMQVDHLCRNKLCVRPDHLDIVTPKENFSRVPRETMRHVIRSRTRVRCGKGHPLTSDNVFHRKNESFRRCRTCHRLQSRRHHWRLGAKPRESTLKSEAPYGRVPHNEADK